MFAHIDHAFAHDREYHGDSNHIHLASEKPNNTTHAWS
jgi:hypothetical protein